MKKGKKRKISKGKVSKNLESKKHVFALIGLFLFLGIALSFISVPQDVSITGYAPEDERGGSTVTDSSGNTFGERLSSGSSGFLSGIFTFLNKILMGGSKTIDESFIRWTFFIVFSILIYSFISMSGFLEGKSFMNWLISIPLAFIVIAMINQTDFLASIQGYGAVGLTMIAMLPLGGMILFSSQLLKKMTAGKIIFQLILWWYFLAFSLYLIIRYALNTINISVIVLIIMLLPSLVAIGIIWKNKWFRGWVQEIGREIGSELAKDTSQSSEDIRTAGSQNALSTGGH